MRKPSDPSPETDALARLEATRRANAEFARDHMAFNKATGNIRPEDEANTWVQCADDLAALRRTLQDDQARSAETVKVPAPQHAAENEKG